MLFKIRWIYFFCTALFTLVWVRLFQLQVLNSRYYSLQALNQYQSLQNLIPPRGQILASDGFSLAIDMASKSGSSLRYYPEGSQSAYLTGFLGKDSSGNNVGYFGLEGYYDRLLRGKIGRLSQETDVFNRPILLGRSDLVPSESGSDVQTSIDRSVQFFATKILQEGLEKYQSTGGTVSILESKTGRILAMVSVPSYNPNNYSQFDTAAFKNPIISEGYEPGSTFKPLVMAAAFDAKVINQNTLCDICSGPYQIGTDHIRSWDSRYYSQSSMSDIILHSDNVGMTFVAQKLGKDKLIHYLKLLNFGQKTGIDLQEESTPPLKPIKDWYPIDVATASFGQGIAVTRLQLLLAINSIANRGLYYFPSVVTDVINGDVKKHYQPKKSQRVYSQNAADIVLAMMVNGVENGEVRYYRPKNYSIAGKTGTAQVPIFGHYDPNMVISSFIGFAPANDPKFTMLVTLNNPKSSPWGSQTAAPLWFEIAKHLFLYYHIAPNI